MKIDHLVVNVDSAYQEDPGAVSLIRRSGFPYEPEYGKGTSGFKASNLWIGDEYFELVRLKTKEGGGWRQDWVELYNEGQRGLVCLFLDTDDIDREFLRLQASEVDITTPEWLQFKWFFGLFTRNMPWRNAYLPFFEHIPIQLGFQQMKNQKSKDYMLQYMQPNSRENGITGISKVAIYGKYSDNDKAFLATVFPGIEVGEKDLAYSMKGGQQLMFIQSETHRVVVECLCADPDFLEPAIQVENISVIKVLKVAGRQPESGTSTTTT